MILVCLALVMAPPVVAPDMIVAPAFTVGDVDSAPFRVEDCTFLASERKA